MNNKYPKPMMAVHWLTLILVLIAYFTSKSPIQLDALGQVHVSAGIAVFLISFIRVLLLLIYKKELPNNKIINQYQEKLFKYMRSTLYILIFIVPLLGWFALSSLTPHFSILSIQLILLHVLDQFQYIGLTHQVFANIFITLVGLHACAALIHHFIFKDNVLKSMLPGRNNKDT